MEASHFPLSNPGQKELQALCNRLRGWQECEACLRSQPCSSSGCPWPNSSRLNRFFHAYKNITRSFIPEIFVSGRPLLSSHNDVLSIIEQIQKSKDRPRGELIASHKSSVGLGAVNLDDDAPEFDLVVRVSMMVNCSSTLTGWGSLEGGSRPTKWASDMSHNDFVKAAFPKSLQSKFNEKDTSPSSQQRFDSIRATKLSAVVSFRSTDDMCNHLRLNHQRGTVEIFHHTAVLKEYLKCSETQ